MFTPLFRPLDFDPVVSTLQRYSQGNVQQNLIDGQIFSK